MADLTDFFGAGLQLASSYLSRPQINVGNPTTIPQAAMSGYKPGEGFDMPGFDIAPQPPAFNTGCGPYPVLKRVCGEYKWVFPKRRKRPLLLSKGDAKGLAALKGILGNGKAMEVWIATHS